MSNAVPYLLQGKNIILVVDGKSHTISKDTHIAYGKIVDALKAQDWDALRNLVEPKKAIVNFGKGYVSIEGTTVMWKGKPFHNALATRMIEMFHDGFPIDPMVRFMERLMKNTSKRSVDQVYGFLEKNNLPITEDGYFLAFKKVRRDYLDIHSGTISNVVGSIVEMDRNLVDDNPDSHCSSGLHFCSESYLGSFGGHGDPIMILKIDPADVVSIPTDYNGAKGRCSRYEVVGQVEGSASQAFGKIINTDYAAKDQLVPAAAWPFPGRDAEEDEYDFVPGDTDELYDVVRVFGGMVEGSGLTLEEAQDRVEKNVRQKKAQLKIVKSGTDEEVQ